MTHDKTEKSDFGTGQKKFEVYLLGIIACALLTLLSFWVVMSGWFAKGTIITIIYLSAFVQLLVQLMCFIRLNTKTEQGKINVMSFIFTGVILISIVLGSLWIMSNLHYNMSN